MEYNNDNQTPRDRLEDDFLRELLSGELPDMYESHERGKGSCTLGDDKRRYNRRNRSGRPQNNVMPVAEMMSDSPENWSENDDDCACYDKYVCGCGDCENFKVPKLQGVPLSMVYSPYQEWENLYDPETGLKRGTIFKCLDFPFYPVRCNGYNSTCKNHCR